MRFDIHRRHSFDLREEIVADVRRLCADVGQSDEFADMLSNVVLGDVGFWVTQYGQDIREAQDAAAKASDFTLASQLRDFSVAWKDLAEVVNGDIVDDEGHASEDE